MEAGDGNDAEGGGGESSTGAAGDESSSGEEGTADFVTSAAELKLECVDGIVFVKVVVSGGGDGVSVREQSSSTPMLPRVSDHSPLSIRPLALQNEVRDRVKNKEGNERENNHD